MAKTVKATIGAAAILGALLTTAPVAAQDPVPQCNGLDATIVKTEWGPDDHDIDGPQLLGTEGDDVIVFTYTNYVFEQRSGLRVDGREGNDTICAQSTLGPRAVRDIVILGGEGNDTIFSAAVSGVLRTNTIGGPGDDILHGGPQRDRLAGGPGNDVIYGYQGIDLIDGEAGDDVLHAGAGGDIVDGGSGDDSIFGSLGGDIIYGGLGKDAMFGGRGNDVLYSHKDLDGISLEDDIWPEERAPIGINSSSLALDTAGSRMFAGPGNDVLIGSNRWDRMQGGPGDDFMLGLEGRDWMRGGPGNDTILGGLGIDDVNGNQGFDEIVVVGKDTVRGGYGRDACLNGPGSVGVSVRSCESAGPIGPKWADLTEEILLRTTPLRSEDLVLGDCLIGDSILELYEKVSCTEPHDFHVYAQGVVPRVVRYRPEYSFEESAAMLCGGDPGDELADYPGLEHGLMYHSDELSNIPTSCLLFDPSGNMLPGQA